jgi:hypothetical protein
VSPANLSMVAADAAASTECRRSTGGSGRSALGTVENLANRRREILYAGAGHNDRISPPVGFFGNAQEFSTFVLPELHVKMLSLDLQLSRFDDVIHALQTGEFTAPNRPNGRRFCPKTRSQNPDEDYFYWILR